MDNLIWNRDLVGLHNSQEVLSRHFCFSFVSVLLGQAWPETFHPKQWRGITCVYKFKERCHPPTHPTHPNKTWTNKKTLYLRQPATKNIQKHPYNNINNVHTCRENYVKKQLLHTHHTPKPRICQAKGWCSGKPMAEHIVPLVMPFPPLSLSVEFFLKSWGWWQTPSNHHQVIWITRNNNMQHHQRQQLHCTVTNHNVYNLLSFIFIFVSSSSSSSSSSPALGLALNDKRCFLNRNRSTCQTMHFSC